jgi:pimeloyl-ACP methyl ester carboxylesterase
VLFLDAPLPLFWMITTLVFGALALLGVVLILQWWKRHRGSNAARLKAEQAIDSHDLDLDARLGELRTVKISSDNAPNSLEISYRQTGHGPDLLCLHGIGASMIIYRRFTPLVSSEFRVTCLDFPGFGRSEKPRELTYGLDEQAQHLQSAVEALDLKHPIVIASSMGGAISMAAAVKAPDLFRGIVALAPATDPTRIPTALLPMAKFGEALHRLNPEKTRYAIVKTVVAQVIARRELITPGLVALYFEPFRISELASAAFLKAFRLLADKRLPALFRELKTPLLIVRGLRDRLVKQSSCEDLHRIVPDSELVTHPTAGHHSMEDEPEFIAEELRKFAAKL